MKKNKLLQAEEKRSRKLVGLIPAGGKASRLAPLPCSKELYPVGFRVLRQGQGLRPKVVCHYLLERIRLADVTQAYIVIGKSKWDIPAYFGDGKMLNMHLAYLIRDLPFGVPYSLDQAYPFVKDAIVLLGFPDILFNPEDAFVRLLARQKSTEADIVLGLFPCPHPGQMDMVHLDADGRILEIKVKPGRTHLRFTWAIAVWTHKFTKFMHDYVKSDRKERKKHTNDKNSGKKRELILGEVVQAAIDSKMHIDGVLFPNGNCLDIGVPENLVKALQMADKLPENSLQPYSATI